MDLYDGPGRRHCQDMQEFAEPTDLLNEVNEVPGRA
jgi:hypothetical protein